MANPEEAAFEAEIRARGEELLRLMQGREPGIFHPGFWQRHLLEKAMEDASFRADLFRFIDVLPCLTSPAQISAHIADYLLREGRILPQVLRLGVKAAAGGGLAAGLAARALRAQVETMATRFIAARDASATLAALQKLRAEGVAFTVDLLGETTLSEAEAVVAERRYLELMDLLAGAAADWPPNPLLDSDPQGPLPRADISVKVSALVPFLDPVDSAGAVRRLKARALQLAARARERGLSLTLDMENYELKGIILDLFEELAGRGDFRAWPHIGLALQAYLVSAPDDLERLLSLARRRGAPLNVRLVKGAYWDYEVVRSRMHGYPCPVLTDKAATDLQYERLACVLLENRAHLRPAFGTHNLRSLAHVLATAAKLGAPETSYEFQMLYGMAEPERAALRSLGRRVRVYTPVGELLPGMAYLVRRLLENTSNVGFLRLAHREHRGADELLRRPVLAPPAPEAVQGLLAPFRNCPLTDFAEAGARRDFSKALELARARLPQEVAAVVSGMEIRRGEVVTRPCPDEEGLAVSRVHYADIELAGEAVAAAARALPAWRGRTLAERAGLLDRLGHFLERDRFELAALMVHEVAKPWREADADVGEAVDFCRYYAQRASVELGERKLSSPPGEDNRMLYEGRGVCAVIAPWNFPLAILAGMSAAALVAGNTVVLKPAEQSSAVAAAFHRRILEAGIPSSAAHFLPGRGEIVGAYLVEHPEVATVAFTGSLAVGLAILERSARPTAQQKQLKRVILELGGKNAIIVDEDADLDETALGILRSAFGYAGQKCSACSRLIVHEGVYDTLLRRLLQAIESWCPAPAREPGCLLPPVVDADAQRRLLGLMEHPPTGARLLYKGRERAGGCFVPPAVFEVRDPDLPLLQEELFGPVLAVLPARNFAEALDIAARSRFALTGAVYSRRPAHLGLARARFRTGNLYLNRPCTGAMVGRQPFGGFNMSGVGFKSGGPDYLLQFAEPRVIAENTLRRGFAPDVA